MLSSVDSRVKCHVSYTIYILRSYLMLSSVDSKDKCHLSIMPSVFKVVSYAIFSRQQSKVSFMKHALYGLRALTMQHHTQFWNCITIFGITMRNAFK